MQPLLEDLHHFRREAFGFSRELLNRSPRNGQQSSTLLIQRLLEFMARLARKSRAKNRTLTV